MSLVWGVVVDLIGIIVVWVLPEVAGVDLRVIGYVIMSASALSIVIGLVRLVGGRRADAPHVAGFVPALRVILLFETRTRDAASSSEGLSHPPDRLRQGPYGQLGRNSADGTGKRCRAIWPTRGGDSRPLNKGRGWIPGTIPLQMDRRSA